MVPIHERNANECGECRAAKTRRQETTRRQTSCEAYRQKTEAEAETRRTPSQSRPPSRSRRQRRPPNKSRRIRREASLVWAPSRRTGAGIGWREWSDNPKRKPRLNRGWPGKVANGRFARLVIWCRHDAGVFQDAPANAKTARRYIHAWAASVGGSGATHQKHKLCRLVVGFSRRLAVAVL